MLFFVILAYFCQSKIIQAQLAGHVRILGGEETTINNYPYQVSIERIGRHICGGSIIRTSTIVTAAHCLRGREPSTFRVRAGSTRMMSGGTVVSVRAYRIHPQFQTTPTIDFDLALIYLSKSLTFSSAIQPIALSTQRLCGNGNVVASGWGRTTEGGSVSEMLRRVKIQIISYRTCSQTYTTGVGSAMFCAGTMSGGKDTCQGDSGGPLMMNGELVGITSNGVGCGRTGLPGLYTSIRQTRDWILRFISF